MDVAAEIESLFHDFRVRKVGGERFEFVESRVVFVFRIMAVGSVVECEGIEDVGLRVGVFGEERVEQLGGNFPILEP